MAKTYPKDLYYIDNAIKLHFRDDAFDAIKYRMRVRKVSDATFERNRGFSQYVRWTGKLNDRKIHPIEFILANVIAEESVLYHYSLENYELWRGRIESLQYKVIEQLNAVMVENNIDKFSQLFKIDTTKSDYPIIVEAYLDKKIWLETLTVINMFVKFTDKLQVMNLGWDDIRRNTKKYEPFLKRMINVDKMKVKLLETYK